MHIRRAAHTCASWCAVSLHLLGDEDKGNDNDDDDDKKLDKPSFDPFLVADTDIDNWVRAVCELCVLVNVG